MKPYRRTFRRLLSLLAAVAIFSFLYLLMYNTIRTGQVFPKSTFYKNLIDYVYNFIPILVLTVSNYFVIFRLWRGTIIEKHLPVKILSDFIVGFVILTAVNLLYVVVATWLHLNPQVVWAGSILCNTLLILGLEIAYYIKRTKEAIKRAEYTKRELIQYKYDSLKAQLNPHFLFNSLNIQLALILSDQRKAYDYTIALSQIYRYILDTQNRSAATLSEELEFLRNYVSILEKRFNKLFTMEIEGEEECGIHKTVPFTMQLLIENAIKHNVISRECPMNVKITIDDSGIRVMNRINLKPDEPERGNGIGLKYISGQYERYGKSFRIINDGVTFTAIIPHL